jgi:NAD-dependent dihydropyrimidine dehydrogenase PreA subunit
MTGVSALNTLRFDLELCTGCGICVDVCPHAVFARNSHVVHVVRPDACMECGACQVNCAFGAVKVDSGVGCASAMIRAALVGKPQAQASCG